MRYRGAVLCVVTLISALQWGGWASQHLDELDDAERNRRVAGVVCSVRYVCSEGEPPPMVCYQRTTKKKRVKLKKDDPRREAWLKTPAR